MCVNCGSKEHLSSNCPKPQVPREQRPCWKCGKPGHTGAQCRGGAPRLAGMVDGGEPVQPIAFHVGLGPGEHYERILPFTPVGNSKAAAKPSRPLPRMVTMADLITGNSFSAPTSEVPTRKPRRKRGGAVTVKLDGSNGESKHLIKTHFESNSLIQNRCNTCDDSKCTNLDCTRIRLNRNLTIVTTIL